MAEARRKENALSPRGKAESGEWQLGNLSGRNAGYWGAVTWLLYDELVNAPLIPGAPLRTGQRW
jgi:hypothetical protein